MSDDAHSTLKRRVDFLRELSQGEGLSAAVPPNDDAYKRVFDVASVDELWMLIDSAADLMPDSPHKRAVLNALRPVREGDPVKDSKEWLRAKPLNLTERRTRMLADDLSISYRTLVRHEQEGAEILAKYLDIAKTFEASTEVDGNDDDGVEFDLEVLRTRVHDLERSLAFYVEYFDALDDLIQKAAVPGLDRKKYASLDRLPSKRSEVVSIDRVVKRGKQ